MQNLIRVISNSAEETESLGFKVGSILKRYKVPQTVYLFGDLGTGKTVFIKGLAKAYGINPREVGSASFVIIAEYDTSPPFYHIDLYRVEGTEALDSLGIWEYIESEGVTAIEWAERIEEIPSEGVKVCLKFIEEKSREITIEGIDEKDWHNL
ncbi:MAG: tRNA (adenosine(37)-N6)-threonylcarbamoyltransferase complex ATPase subunit type 1 TsaE [Thermodesulfovibrionales bacterium]|nr:tRNA (adenosine(37)-N6)-threonylcarbamoyltransferase complex ATPase subunit type 1 TsaE [Thermodesulfovibrionales bacterium]